MTEKKGHNCEINSKNRICYHSKLITFLSIIFSTAATFIAWILIFQVSISSGFSKYFSTSNEYVLRHPQATMDPLTLHNIGEMVANGTLLSLDDLWSFQGTFYQTIITVLIALNAILGAFAFFMIKQSSNAKAREEAILEVKSYVESKAFDREVRAIANEKIAIVISEKVGAIQLDLESQIESISLLASKVEEIDTTSAIVKDLQSECKELRRHISTLAFAISKNDAGDSEGSKLTLKEGF